MELARCPYREMVQYTVVESLKCPYDTQCDSTSLYYKQYN